RVAEARFQEIKTYRNAHGQKDMAAGYRALVDRDEFARYDNLESRRKEILGRSHSILSDVLATFRRNLLGETRNKANLRNMVHEIFGRKTGDNAASELAEAWSEAAEFLRMRANRGGMAIPKRKDWGMPQTHNTLKVREVEMQEWVNFVRNKVDPKRLIDYSRGFSPNSLEIDLILREAYETITTEGFSNSDPALTAGRQKLGNKRAEHRYLPFKDSEAWLEYHDRFGEGDPFSVMMAHVDGMSRDIARLEIFGPNDEAMRDFLKESARKSAAQKDAKGDKRKGLAFRNWKDYTNGIINQTDNMVEAFTGRLNHPVNDRIASGFAGFRSLHAAAVLGSAVISALTDINYQRIAARAAGLPQTRILKEVLANLMTLDDVPRGTLATRLGLIAEQWATVGSAQMRYVGEVEGPEVARRMSDAVLRVSGLSPWTQANRWGFGQAFLGDMADNVGKRFGELDLNSQGLMKKYGISEADWDQIRKTPLYDASVDIDGFSGPGTLFMRPENIMKRTDITAEMADQLTNKLLRMVQSETEFAVPTVSLKGRVQIVGNTKPGTFQGELLRSAAMYKTFALTILNTHINRVMAQPGALAKGKAAADLVISTTLMGGMALQLKEIVKGKDPRPMEGEDSVPFWTSALVQGGGLGLFGDFLFGDLNRFGGGLPQQLAGPVVQFGDDVVRRAFLGNIFEFAQGDDTNFGREMVRLLRRYTPGGSIWYARLAYERLLLDQMQLWADPEAKKNLRQQRQRFRRNTGQRFWWNPGTTSPQRAPEFTR
ncbi:MAG: hypothetical protein ACPG5T_03235, partial [Endozoicomonas sp.]